MATIESPRYDWLRRGARTFAQAFIGLFALLMTPLLQEVVNAVKDGRPIALDFNAVESILIASAAAGVIALIAFVQNLLEDKTPHFPAPLKGVPNAGQNPVPDPDPYDPLDPDTWPSPPPPAPIRGRRADGPTV